MPHTEEQLTQALTAEFVAQRTLMEALINRVTSILTSEQIARLELQDQVNAIREQLNTILVRIRELEFYTHSANEQRAHMMLEMQAIREAQAAWDGTERRKES